jgi:lipoprotein-releasing system permease protein
VSFELFIALRYLLARRQQSSISRVSLFSTIGVAVGVVALVVALALMTGLQGELRNRILGSQAHIYVWKTGSLVDYESEVAQLRAVPGVAGAGPAILGKAIVSSDRTSAFITLKGVDPVLEGQVTDVERTLTQGSLEALTDHGEDDRPGILLGHDLAQQLGASVGDEITLITPGGSLSPMGLMPRNRRVKVVGVFQLGLYEYDSAISRVASFRRRRPTSFNCGSTTSGLRQASHGRSRSAWAPSTSPRTGPSSIARSFRRFGSRRWLSRSRSGSSSWSER